jgi:hypothetical protein
MFAFFYIPEKYHVCKEAVSMRRYISHALVMQYRLIQHLKKEELKNETEC